MFAAIDRALRALESDDALLQPARWIDRARALDRLEQLSLDAAAHRALAPRARALHEALTRADEALFSSLRAQVRAGHGRAALSPWLEAPAPAALDGYDPLDALMAGLLALEAPEEPLTTLEDGMVFYQPTPARSVLELCALSQLGPADIVLDCGSGLGHVALLGAIVSEARFVGVEREPAYVQIATRCARSLGVERASFLCADLLDSSEALARAMREASVMYLFTPCKGALLDRLIQRIRERSTGRPLRIASLGPSSEALASQRWLRARGAVDRARVVVFDPVAGA